MVRLGLGMQAQLVEAPEESFLGVLPLGKSTASEALESAIERGEHYDTDAGGDGRLRIARYVAMERGRSLGGNNDTLSSGLWPQHDHPQIRLAYHCCVPTDLAGRAGPGTLAFGASGGGGAAWLRRLRPGESV
jgi:hypothetical protein